MNTRCGKIGWQAEAPAPRWRQWGRRFRLPTGIFNGVGAAGPQFGVALGAGRGTGFSGSMSFV